MRMNDGLILGVSTSAVGVTVSLDVLKHGPAGLYYPLPLEERYVTMTEGIDGPRTKGRVLHSEAHYYDLLAWLLTFGRERAFRERLVGLARVDPGDTVLDVGCGTGTLAIAAKRRVGAAGAVHGVDASLEMIER